MSIAKHFKFLARSYPLHGQLPQRAQPFRSRCFYSPNPSRSSTSLLTSVTIKTGVPRTDTYRRTIHSKHNRHDRQNRDVRLTPDPGRPFETRRWFIETTLVVLMVCGVGYFIVHLERVPETGRWRFMAVSPSFEAYIAKERHKALLLEFGNQILPPESVFTQHVRNIVAKILEANDLGYINKDQKRVLDGAHLDTQVQHSQDREGVGEGGHEDVWNWETTADEDVFGDRERVPGNGGRAWNVIVVNDLHSINAASSYGDIIVFTGLFRLVKNDNELAAVIGHEIGHVVARHMSERLSNTIVFTGIGFLLDSIGIPLTELITTLFLELPGSRKQEVEADMLGIKFMAKACYDPKAAIDMHTRLGQITDGGGTIEFLNTHPLSSKRIKHLESLLEEAYTIQAATPGCGSMYESMQEFQNALGSYSPQLDNNGND